MKKYIFISQIIALCFNLTAKADIPFLWDKIDAESDSIAYLLEDATFHDYYRQKYNHTIQQLETIADKKEIPQLKARAYYWKAWSISKENSDSAEVLLNKAFYHHNPTRYPYDNARFLFLKGNIMQYSGKWSDAYRIYKEQEKYFASCLDIFSQAKVMVCIGTILQELNENKEALKYYQLGNNLFEKINCINCQTKNRINISNSLYLLGEKDKALDILLELEQNSIAQQDTLYMVNLLISLFRVSDMQKTETPDRAHRLAKEQNYRQLYSLTLLTLGIEMLSKQKNDSALYYYHQALNEAEINHDVYRKAVIFRGLSESYNRLNNPDSAYYYLLLADTYQDSLLNHNKIIELNRLESRATIERYESDLKKAEEKALYHRNITSIITLFIILLSTLIFYILWLSRRKAIMDKQLKDAENRELQLLNKQYLIEIESKNRELSSNTLILAQTNAKLKELYDQVELFKSNVSIDQEESEKLKSHIKSQLIVNDDWQYFILNFEQVHPQFLSKLKKQHPNLSETDLKLCAYIRIGMSAKEIAQILSVQPDTVNTSRYRMRKKIGLNTGDSLEDYLRTF